MDAGSTVVQFNVGALVALIVAIATMVFAFGRVLLTQFEKRIAERFQQQDVSRKEQSRLQEAARTEQQAAADGRFVRIERQLGSIDGDLRKLNTDLPLHYVRREDWIRFSGTIDAKLDRLNEKLEPRRQGERSDA